MSVKFTAGPWAVYQNDPVIIVDTEGYSLGEMTMGTPDGSYKKMCANAILAASAPELVEALADLLAASERHIFGDECLAEREAARAILRKATGE